MHTSFPKGTTLFIIFKDGTTTTGKFSDRKSGKVLLEDGRELNIRDVRAMSPRKLETEETGKSSKKIIFRKDS